MTHIHKNHHLHATSQHVLEQRIKNYGRLNETEKQHELDLYHLILKHYRHCDNAMCLETRQAIQHAITQAIMPSSSSLVSFPLLTCMVDLVKNKDSSCDTGLFLDLSCPLWQLDKIYMCRKSMQLCYLLIPQLTDVSALLPCVMDYITSCKKYLTRYHVRVMQSPDYTEFFYTAPVNTAWTCDRECIKWLIHIILSIFLHHPDLKQTLTQCFIDLCQDGDPNEYKPILFDLCCANDDDTIALLDLILTLYQQNHQQPFLQALDINPHNMFLFFLSRCGDTHDILIDLLLEPNFLPYFHRYILYAMKDMTLFLNALQDKKDTFLTLLANTILVLEGNGFPYNTKPLIRRLIQFENQLYE